MGSKDLKSNISMTVTHTKIATTANRTIVGKNIVGFNGACFVIDVGTHTADDLVVTYQDSDDGSTWANIAETDLDGVGTVQSRAIVAADDDTQIYVGYKGIKKYIGVVITDSGTGSAVIGSYVIAGYPQDMPKNNS